MIDELKRKGLYKIQDTLSHCPANGQKEHTWKHGKEFSRCDKCGSIR